ncbi:hypothetical protein AYO39_02850 [Actinobacteria bacterium SCGC AG-212-D09]|nr:hypothetical protein AYO39_02850 [Actinobacteria bacterium SCGC AG-212-D09]
MSIFASGRQRRESRSIAWTRWGVLAAVPIVFLAVPTLAHVPARLVAGCPTWIALAGLLELGSIAGFIGSFALVFGPRTTRRQSATAALRALGAITVLPAGGLVGPAIGVRSGDRQPAPLGSLVRSTIAFTILTTAPSVAALALFGAGLWLGWPSGPHGALLTLPAAAGAGAGLVLIWLLGRGAPPAIRPQRPVPRALRWITGAAAALRGGAAEARRLLARGNWKLLGATVAYYAFDNAVLWAAFRAYGSAPPLGVIVMGYLVGSLAAALPIPGGLGAIEGGLIGALVLYGAPGGAAAGAVLLYRGVSLGLALSLSATAWAVKRPPRPASATLTAERC